MVLAMLVLTGAARADDLDRAEQLAWNKQFAESEALYRTIVAKQPSRRAQLGLARVVMWQGRYAEAIERFDELLRTNARDVDALEGRATAAYWSGDFRSAQRDFRRVVELDPKREFARTSLSEIASTMRPEQRIVIGGSRDDQPLDVNRGAVAATFYSDPLTRWTAAAGATHLETERRGERTAEHVRIEGDTRWRGLALNGSAGVIDGDFIGHALVGWKSLSLRIERREELASATGIRANAFSTTTTLRWSRERESLVAAAQASHRTYSDDNRGHALVAYAVAPLLRRGPWTVWAGGSAAARDTEETRFHATAVSSTREQTFFRYSYRGEYDPYWTPDDLIEARAVFAVERAIRFGSGTGSVKLHADAGAARDKGRAFGPDAGSGPFPPQVLTFTFDRDYNPYRFGLAANVPIIESWRFEAGIDRSVTVDYRSTSFHAALVRRR
jgi:tetratricopeptide (TPR) repeat protein